MCNDNRVSYSRHRAGNMRQVAKRIGRGCEGSKDCIADTACSTRCGTRVPIQVEDHPHRTSFWACAVWMLQNHSGFELSIILKFFNFIVIKRNKLIK